MQTALGVGLRERLRADGWLVPDYDGAGLANVAATVLDVLGTRQDGDLPALRDLDPDLARGARRVMVLLADGLGLGQLERLAAQGATPFLGSLLDRAHRGEAAQLIPATSVFPSTTAAAITTIHTARTPQEHGNLAYFCWLDEFGQVSQMLRWGPAAQRRGSYFDDPAAVPTRYRLVPSVHERLARRGMSSVLVEPEVFRHEAMRLMHAAEADVHGYVLPSTLGVRLRVILEAASDRAPRYTYGYWAGVDTAAHWYGPNSAEHDLEARLLDRTLEFALASRPPGDTLVLLTADHGHAEVDPARIVDLEGDGELRSLLDHPVAGEPRLAFLHTRRPDEVRRYLEARWPGVFTLIDRDEAIEAGLFGRGDAAAARRRVGEVVAMIRGPRAATIVRIEGHVTMHRGAHGGMTPDEMSIPVLAWRA